MFTEFICVCIHQIKQHYDYTKQPGDFVQSLQCEIARKRDSEIATQRHLLCNQLAFVTVITVQTPYLRHSPNKDATFIVTKAGIRRHLTNYVVFRLPVRQWLFIRFFFFLNFVFPHTPASQEHAKACCTRGKESKEFCFT